MIERSLGKFIRYQATHEDAAPDLEAQCIQTAKSIEAADDAAPCRCMARDGTWFDATAGEVKADLMAVRRDPFAQRWQSEWLGG